MWLYTSLVFNVIDISEAGSGVVSLAFSALFFGVLIALETHFRQRRPRNAFA
jgi:hypothetical protein